MVAWTVAGLVICSFYTDPQFTSSCNSDLHGVPNCVWTGLPRYACSWFGCSGLKKGQASNLPRRAKYAALLMAHACHHTGLWNTTLSGGFFLFACLFDIVLSVNVGCPRIRYSVSISRCQRPPSWSQRCSLSVGLSSLLITWHETFDTWCVSD